MDTITGTNTKMNIEVIIADDHPVVRDGIRAAIERKGRGIKIVGEASNGKEVLTIAKKNPADVYVLDIAMPVLNGIETAQRLNRMYIKSKIIILSMYDSRSFVEKALQSGVKGYVLKENATDEIIHAIREIYMDRCFLSPNISKYIVQGFLGKIRRPHQTRGARVIKLTKREREILQLISEGSTSKEIAEQLEVSFNTVHVHRNNIMSKLDIHKQAELVRYAIKEGLSEL